MPPEAQYPYPIGPMPLYEHIVGELLSTGRCEVDLPCGMTLEVVS